MIFWFASPLITNFSSAPSINMPQLNFNKEFEGIEKALEESRMQLNYQKTVATLDNLPDILIRNPFVLHFSGHGVKNNYESIGNESVLREGEGDMLLFEDSKCWGVLLSEKNLKTILERCRTDIKWVVVLSCHSEFIGNIFFNAGIPHVVCIREKEKISDSASIIFASAFYKLLFGGDTCNICKAFEGAKATVKLQGSIKWNVGEDQKFILKCAHKSDKCVPIDLNLCRGRWKLINEEPLIQWIPAPVENFVGRQIECKNLIELLNNNRWISVEGLSGVGKSAIIKNVANMLYDRNVFPDGILYLTLRDWNSLEGLFKKMYLYLKSYLKPKNESNSQLPNDLLDVDDFYWEYLIMWNQLTMLLIFDDWNEIIAKDQSSFTKFMEDILEKLPKIKVIISSIHSIPTYSDVNNRVVKVKELSNKQTLELLKLNSESISTHNSDIRELIGNQTNTEVGKII